MEHCTNLNHNKMNVPVRHCSACGEIVNRKIRAKACSEPTHSRRRKERCTFCIDCGSKLMD